MCVTLLNPFLHGIVQILLLSFPRKKNKRHVLPLLQGTMAMCWTRHTGLRWLALWSCELVQQQPVLQYPNAWMTPPFSVDWRTRKYTTRSTSYTEPICTSTQWQVSQTRRSNFWTSWSAQLDVFVNWNYTTCMPASQTSKGKKGTGSRMQEWKPTSCTAATSTATSECLRLAFTGNSHGGQEGSARGSGGRGACWSDGSGRKTACCWGRWTDFYC